MMIAIPDGVDLPAFEPEDCPHCGAPVWHQFSRVEPMTWLEADFLADHVVDEAAMTIEKRSPAEMCINP